MTMSISGSFSIQTHTTFIQNLLKISSFIPFHNILTKKLKKLPNPMTICIRFCNVQYPIAFGFILHVIHDADCDDWSKFLHQMIPRDNVDWIWSESVAISVSHCATCEFFDIFGLLSITSTFFKEIDEIRSRFNRHYLWGSSGEGISTNHRNLHHGWHGEWIRMDSDYQHRRNGCRLLSDLVIFSIFLTRYCEKG